MRTKSCQQVRQQLMRAEIGARVADSRHLAQCPECARFWSRLQAARETLAAPGPHVIADPMFAARVVQALPAARDDTFGWAAMRFLPAAVALVLVLGVWCWTATLTPSSLVQESPTDDLIEWLLQNGGEES